MKLQKHRGVLLTVLGALVGTQPALSGDVYRWTDENGRVVFSENVPPGMKAEQISTRVAPRKPGAEKPAARPTEQEPVPAEGPAGEQAKKAPQDPALRAANCRQARDVLTQLETRPRLKALDAAGEPYFITDKERAERIAAAKKSVEAWCD